MKTVNVKKNIGNTFVYWQWNSKTGAALPEVGRSPFEELFWGHTFKLFSAFCFNREYEIICLIPLNLTEHRKLGHLNKLHKAL